MMPNKYLRTYFLMLCALLVGYSLNLVGCTQVQDPVLHQPKLIEVVDIAKILASKNIPNKIKAEELVKSGEKLVTSIGFMFAHEVFTKAISEDPENITAKFYLASLNPMMKMKGILHRIRPLILKKGTPEEIRLFQLKVDSYPDGGLRDFLLNKSGAIFKSTEEVQKFFSSYVDRLDKLRNFFKANKNMSLSINLNLQQEGASERCFVKKISEYNYKISPCDQISITQRLINRADFEMFQHVTAGREILLTALTSYNLDGIQELDQRGSNEMNSQELTSGLKSFPNFGRKINNNFSRVPKMGADIYAGMKWAYRMRKVVCPLGRSAGSYNRAGYYYNQGICDFDGDSSDDVQKLFTSIDLALSGISQDFHYRSRSYKDGDETRVTEINPLKLFHNPIENLRHIMPVKFDKCGEVTGFTDKTLGGTFPLGNAGPVVEFMLYDSDKADTCT